MIAHIVLFSPKDHLDLSMKRSLAQSVINTCRSISSIHRAVVGRSVAIQAGYDRFFGDKTYDFAAVLEFKERKDLVAYLNHPLHEELGKLFWEACERTTISEVEWFDLEDPNSIDALVL